MAFPTNFPSISYFPTMAPGFSGAASISRGSAIPTGLPVNRPGQNPQVPYPTQTQPSAISGNLNVLPQLGQMAGGINQIQEAGALNQLGSFLPNYQSLVSGASGVTGQELAGQLPADVVSEIMQGAAERGITTGGGANANAAYLRALGLNSLQLQQTGMSNLSNLIGLAPKPALFDPSQFLVTPEQQQQAAVANAIYASAEPQGTAAQQELAALKAGMGAAPRVSAPTAAPASAFGQDTGSPFPALDVGQLGPYGATSPEDPNAAYSNWAAFASQIPVATSADGGRFYAGPDYSDLGDTGDYSE